jgi:hypothetical protein
MISSLDRLIDAANADLPERFREAALKWARLDGRARELEEGKARAFAKRARTLTGLSVAAAEREVKSSPEWHDIETEAAQARTEANVALGEVDYLRMKFRAWLAVRASEEAVAA